MTVPPRGRAILVDMSPLVAWFDHIDADHHRCSQFFANVQGPLLSTWPVVTEVCHRLPTAMVPHFLEWIQLIGLQLIDIPQAALQASGSWMVRY